LETLDSIGKSSGGFDQFKGRNATSYKEETYTTSLDMSRVTDTQRRKGEALEKEILNQQTSNVHLKEERN